MSWIKLFLVNSIRVILISVTLILLVDFTFGKYLFPYYFGGRLQEKGQSLRIKEPIFHHGLSPNYDGFDTWGYDKYRICTNYLGFKDDCKKPLQARNKVDLAFIGDSFTEGVGLPYEDTFVGQIAQARPDLRIVNMGVSSYSPTIYFAKVKELLRSGFVFKELVVYIDISDIQDEAISYKYDNAVVKDISSETSKDAFQANRPAKIFFSEKFPIIFRSLWMIHAGFRKLYGDELIYDHKEIRSAWTYDDPVSGYGDAGVDAAILKSQIMMDELYKLLEKNNIKLSIGVYPWPAQILYDQENSKQVKLWKIFCKDKCKHFYNSFPTFFRLKKNNSSLEIVDKYFIHGDIHFNARGANLIAKDFLDTYED